MVRQYDSFSHVYAVAGFNQFGGEIAKRLVRAWRGVVPPGAPILDLACGEGASGRPFAKAGYRLVSLDLSGGMLTGAAGDRVQGDMRRLPFRACFQAIVCLYDAVNHIPAADLAAFFRECHAALLPGGVMAFDANTLSGSTMWIDEPCVIAKRDLRVEVRTEFDRNRMHMRNHVRGWVTEGAGRRAIDEVVDEWYHAQSVLESAFVEAGFLIRDEYELCMDETRPEAPSKWAYELARGVT